MIDRPAERDARFWCLAAAFAALALTLAKPRYPVSRPVFSHVFVVDITRSMNVTDYERDGRPLSRLDYVKHALREALRSLPCGSSVGLGLFTERRPALLFEPVEICRNFGPIDRAIAEIDWRMAWAADSYVAKGLLRSIELIKGLDANLVFLSDGHEAPPMNENYRPVFEAQPGEVKGLIVGTGGFQPAPIPKFDEDNRQVGFYEPDEVPHETRFGLPPLRFKNRPGYHERNAPFGAQPAVGNEHLSAVRERHLKEYASETGLGYHHLEDTAGLVAALQAPRLARSQTVEADLRWLPAALALVLVLIVYGLLPLAEQIKIFNQRKNP